VVRAKRKALSLATASRLRRRECVWPNHVFVMNVPKARFDGVFCQRFFDALRDQVEHVWFQRHVPLSILELDVREAQLARQRKALPLAASAAMGLNCGV